MTRAWARSLASLDERHALRAAPTLGREKRALRRLVENSVVDPKLVDHVPAGETSEFEIADAHCQHVEVRLSGELRHLVAVEVDRHFGALGRVAVQEVVPPADRNVKGRTGARMIRVRGAEAVARDQRAVVVSAVVGLETLVARSAVEEITTERRVEI